MTTTIYGLTGGVGMGKSTVAKLIEEMGVPVVDSDVLARKVVEPGEYALIEIAAQFGDEYLDAEGGLDREKMARLVFECESERLRLETIIHPRVREGWQDQMVDWRVQEIPAGVVVIPLLYEVGVGDEFDGVLCVACTGNTQRERLRQRGWDDAQIAGRIGAQMDIAEKMVLADHVIWNEGGTGLLRDQITRILS
jgi:dephospho-CoA kinase